MHPEGALSVVADEFASGGCDSAAFSAAFAEATVYALRPPSPARPGLLAAGKPGDGHVLVFTSLHQLARHTPGADWVSTTGDDLLGLLPTGYGLLVDAASERPLALPADALRRGAAAPAGPRR